jgi:hypothetical protein
MGGRSLKRFFVSTTFAVVLHGGGACYAISDCVYAGGNFSDGALSCQSGSQFRCSDGDWVPLELPCATPPPPAVVNPATCACTDIEMSTCDQLGQACCVSMEGGRCLKKCCPIQ